jgi:predicted TIM-barrel fold metal-dependent hydrolase
MHANGVDKATLVQVRGQSNNRYVMECVQRFPSIPPFMEMADDAFGASRLMWGSDFPPVAGREGYRNVRQWTMEHMPLRTDADKEWIFGKTALSLYKFAH